MHRIQQLLLMLEFNFCHFKDPTSYAYYLIPEDVYKKFILESRKGYSHCCPCQIAKMILKQVRTLIGIYHDRSSAILQLSFECQCVSLTSEGAFSIISFVLQLTFLCWGLEVVVCLFRDSDIKSLVLKDAFKVLRFVIVLFGHFWAKDQKFVCQRLNNGNEAEPRVNRFQPFILDLTFSFATFPTAGSLSLALISFISSELS